MADPTAALAIRAGHRRLLETFREFDPVATEEDPTHGVRFDPDALRGLIGFLRHEVAPFARREEGMLPPGVARESSALEHAFLAAEIDAFTRAADAVLAAHARGDRPPRADEQRLVRRLHRIEAALELHILRTEDVMDTAGARGTAPASTDARQATLSPAATEGATADAAQGVSGQPRTRTLDRDEIVRFLRRQRWGVLATAGDGQPYAVPVTYAYDGHAVVFASGPGRKLQHLDRNPRVCLTVVEATHKDRWRSVVVTGRAEPVHRRRDRYRALVRLFERSGRRGVPSPRAAARARGARVFRIEPQELTGRANA